MAISKTTAAPVPGIETAANLESYSQMFNPSKSNTAMEQTTPLYSCGDDAIRRNTTVSIMAIGATAMLGFIAWAVVRQNTK